MIIIDLHCDQEHRFEGWFVSSEGFENQRQRQLVRCPVCDSLDIRRVPSAVHLASPATRGESPPAAAPQGGAEITEALLDALRTLAEKCENVGEQFAEEARRIHHEEAPARPIRGVATASDAQELLDEGIPVLPIPPRDLH